MKKWAYYNDADEEKCVWVKELIKAKVVTDGEVDCRPIQAITADDVRGFRRAHFFCGIGVWDYALNLAGWGDRECWTGSCPCPSFSSAGKGQGFDDARHLWPDWVRLIRECKPAVVFGEQADDAIGYGWLDLVQTDMEAQAYAVGKIVLGACSVGAPHIRQRLYFVADTMRESGEWGTRSILREEAPISGARFTDGNMPFRLADGGETGSMANTEHAERRPLMQHREDGRDGTDSGWAEAHSEPGACSEVRGMANTEGERCREAWSSSGRSSERTGDGSESLSVGNATERGFAMRRSTPGNAGHSTQSSESGELGDTEQSRLERFTGDERNRNQSGRIRAHAAGSVAEASFLGGFWRDAEWLWCRDEKYRPVEPGTFPLAHGATNRVLKLRGYGDAITAPVAAEFIKAYIESRSE